MAEAVRTAMRQLAEKRVHECAGHALANVERDMPPSPSACEILVRVQACGLNHVNQALSGMEVAGTVIAAGDGVTRFAVGDEVFGHFMAGSWAWVQAPCALTRAEGPHVEHRPVGLHPLAAAALAESGLTAMTILRAARLRPGQTAVVIGATSRVGMLLVPLLAEAGAKVIAVAPDDDDVRSLGPTGRTADALAARPDADLLVDLVSFGEPYFITAAAPHGTVVTAVPGAHPPGVPRIEITAGPGDLAALAQRALDGSRPLEMAHA
jgi:D-arabinose 1-dehydrogenase-like Zn-dependent alcohol dehydrogenase